LGKIERGIVCSITGCKASAIRSITTGKVIGAGLKTNAERRAYLCKEHYKEYKKASKKDRTLEKLRYQNPR